MRTIILQEVPTLSGSSTHWAINENGRCIEGLGNDEILYASACAIMNRDWPYSGGRTQEQVALDNYKQGVLDERGKVVPAHKDPENDLPF